MTDNKKHIMKSKGEPLSPISMDDEKLLESFFADCSMDIPDDGFSDRVMAALPSAEAEHVTRKRILLEHLWTAACVAVGIIAAIVCQGWEQIQELFYSMKIDFLVTASRALSHSSEALGQTHNLWMILLGAFVLILVWGYNEVADAR